MYLHESANIWSVARIDTDLTWLFLAVLAGNNLKHKDIGATVLFKNIMIYFNWTGWIQLFMNTKRFNFVKF